MLSGNLAPIKSKAISPSKVRHRRAEESDYRHLYAPLRQWHRRKPRLLCRVRSSSAEYVPSLQKELRNVRRLASASEGWTTLKRSRGALMRSLGMKKDSLKKDDPGLAHYWLTSCAANLVNTPSHADAPETRSHYSEKRCNMRAKQES